MDKLWAPWRAPYILKEIKRKPKGCIFCKALEDHKKLRPSQVIEISSRSFSIQNIFPYNNGHLMISPKRHVGELEKLTAAEITDLMDLLRKTHMTLKRVLKPQGFNIGLNLGREAGAGITDHIHFHIVPRWNGDTNFMPLFADTKVLSESLANGARRLRDDIQKRNRKAGK